MDASMIWALRKPITWLWRKLVSLTGAWTVEPIYRQAHDYHLELRNWQLRWVELADGVEYKLITRSRFDEGENTEQSIWIRNSTTTLLNEIHFCVEAKLGNLSYQVPLVAYRLRPGCVARLALLSLPLEDLTVHHKRVFATYDSLQVYPVRIVRDDLIETYSTDGTVWHPSYDDILNGEWRRWAGRLYNVTAIADTRRDNFVRLAHVLCWRHGLWGTEAVSLLAQAWRTKRYRRLPGVLLFALLDHGPVLDMINWVRLLLRIDRIVFESDAATLAASEYVLHKGESARPVRTLAINAASWVP